NLTITNCTGGFNGGRGSSFSPPTPPQTLMIGGNVKCSNNYPNECVFDYVFIGGNLECSGNFGCTLQTDAIGKNVTINNNSGVGGSVNNSLIGGDVKCAGNSPGVVGSGSTVAGTKSGQCAG